MLESLKNWDITAGHSAFLVQIFPKLSVYFIMYGAPDLVVPASGVIQKNKVVFQLQGQSNG